MTNEEKELLLKDLCARLPYELKVQYKEKTYDLLGLDKGRIFVNIARIGEWLPTVYTFDIKPYLRPMSSMTEEERIEFTKLLDRRYCAEDWEGHISTSYCIEVDNVYTDDEEMIKYHSPFSMDAIDWLNKRMFDYRGLIPMGIALPAPEGMYN